MVSSVHNSSPVSDQASTAAKLPQQKAPAAQQAAVPQDQVTISNQAQKAAFADKGHDGDSH